MSIFDSLVSLIIYQICAKVLVHYLVQNVKIDPPLVVSILSLVLLVPRAEHGLVRQVHLRINGATIITAQRDGLLVRAVYSRVRIVLTDII